MQRIKAKPRAKEKEKANEKAKAKPLDKANSKAITIGEQKLNSLNFWRWADRRLKKLRLIQIQMLRKKLKQRQIRKPLTLNLHLRPVEMPLLYLLFRSSCLPYILNSIALDFCSGNWIKFIPETLNSSTGIPIPSFPSSAAHSFVRFGFAYSLLYFVASVAGIFPVVCCCGLKLLAPVCSVRTRFTPKTSSRKSVRL